MTSFLFADAGVPMITLELPAMFMMLIPVILIEGFWIQLRMPVTRLVAWKSVIFSNFYSTLLGTPVAWVFLLGLEFFVPGIDEKELNSHQITSPLQMIGSGLLQAAWLAPYRFQLYWMIPVALIVFLVPSFFLSVLIEGYVCFTFWPEQSFARSWKEVFRANCLSYAFLFLIVAGFLFYSVVTHKPGD